ncbi:hypothetical protein CF311_002684 [Klebsiella aerogenes]|nr:hypothetical protein [Klebsiella aerogenes]
MNNEIERIAQQNDMSIEFVRWFFNEKKEACGEQWFLALGAMWEGWKARGGEATALGLTLQKSREASGCPAGVDLQDWVKQLAAESLQWQMSIPPRIVAGIKADGVEVLANRLQKHLDEGNFSANEVGVIAGAIHCGREMAQQLREGADK